jgi:hypothetical protein
MFELSYIEDDDEVYFAYDNGDCDNHMVVVPVQQAFTRKVRYNEYLDKLCIEPESFNPYEFEENVEDEGVEVVFVISDYLD